jgi:hypothetical protein
MRRAVAGSRPFRCGHFGQQRQNSAIDLLDDRTNHFDRLASGVFEVPVEVALAGIQRAGITATHGDDNVSGSGGLLGERFGELPAGIKPPLAKYCHDRWVELVGGFGPGGKDIDLTPGVVVEEDTGSHAAPRVVDAQEEHGGLLAHGDSFERTGRVGADGLGYRALMTATARAPPTTWAAMKAGAEDGAMPANVLDNMRPTVMAGLAKLVELVKK